MKLPLVYCAEEVVALVNELGFLPFFKNKFVGFSVEECTPSELWFSDAVDGPWEWKGPIVRMGCVYGKVFGNKAGFLSTDTYADFANFRRDGYDFDARVDEGLVGFRERKVFETLEKEGSALSKHLKQASGFGRDGLKGFDTVITRLQMQCYVTVADFEYATDAHGKQYGWGICRYSTPERTLKEKFVDRVYRLSTEEAYKKTAERLGKLLPLASTSDIESFLR